MKKIERNKLIKSCHEKGRSQKEIGEIFNLSQSAVSQILILYKDREKGDFIETRGVKDRLSKAQKNELKSILCKKPSEYGFFVWNKWSVQSVIKTELGVSYHENYIYKIMRDIKFSPQKPATKDYRKNTELVNVFKEEKIQDIKKK